MAYDALPHDYADRRLARGAGSEVEISVGADPVLPTRFRIGPAGAAPRGPSDIITDGTAPLIGS